MALSNWDTMAVDLNGKPCVGSFQSPQGVTVQFYKNWLYIGDEKAWVDGRSYVRPTIAQVNSGDLCYGDVSIRSVRGPQDGIYAVITSGYGEEEIGIIGCGVYGFEGEEWVGVKKESVEFLRGFLNQADSLTREEALEEVKRFGEAISDVEQAVEIWMRPSYEFSEKVRAVSFDGALRFNQGDAYFAGHAGEDTPASVPGEAEKPVLLQMLDKKNEEEK